MDCYHPCPNGTSTRAGSTVLRLQAHKLAALSFVYKHMNYLFFFFFKYGIHFQRRCSFRHIDFDRNKSEEKRKRDKRKRKKELIYVDKKTHPNVFQNRTGY